MMLNKLAFRNAKRSLKDYLIYIITMTIIAAMMFAFDSMIFSKEVRNMCSEAGIMAAMLGIATFFIVLIVAWLINYMAKFMLEKRSKEFGTYLLLGMKRKEISHLYMKENLIMGTIGFMIGSVVGMFLQQIIMTIFYSVFNIEYKVKIDVQGLSVLMTVCCYFGCYLIALFRNKRKFKKMNISELMKMDKENEKIKQGSPVLSQWLFFGSFAYIILFFIKLFEGRYTVSGVILMSMGLIISIYMIYFGIAGYIARCVQKGSRRVYKNNNLFIYRQLSSKLSTMRFTMGSLTILLTCAILGGTIAMMFAKYQDTELKNIMPFDVLIYSNNVNEDFKEETEAIEELAGIKEKLIYHI